VSSPSEDSSTRPNRIRNNLGSPGADNTLRMMMYMFPRQFGLHNVFTSHVDPTQTAQKFQDYTLREEEILNKFRKKEGCTSLLDVRAPKRLRGTPEHLVRRLQTLHVRCSYVELLQHYCPVRT
jgi:telomerase reverse transcriptase